MDNNAWPVLSRYDHEHTQAIALPVGGIGTGFFALGGRGQLTEWQLMSRPNRGWRPPYAHLLLRTQRNIGQQEEIKLRVLEAQSDADLGADFGAPGTLMGVARFPHARFEAAYPFGRVILEDKSDVPVRAVIEAFNPLIPHDTPNSSLPFGLLTITLTNITPLPVHATLTLLMTNIIGTDGIVSDLKDNVTETAEAAGWRGMKFYKARELRTAQNGTMAFLTDAQEVHIARRWPFQGSPWNGEALGIIDSLLQTGRLPDADPNVPCPPSPNDTWHSSLTMVLPPLASNESRTVHLLITWHFPLRNLQEEGWWSPEAGQDPIQTNWYATQFQDALDVARGVIPRLPDLREKTIAFVKSVVEHPAPHALREAALFNLTPLRTHTCFRLADGTFLGWEGCAGQSGCCIGSCTHVWNYEVATLSLFPDLHRSMLESHLNYGVVQDGGERFRLSLPLINPTWYGAAADGQMGLIVRVYSQYLNDKEHDGEAWLRKVYPTVKRMLAFAWLPGGWDADKDGVMEGSQHNTYDVEFFGPNPLCTGWYLAALEATARMAEIVGDADFANTCRELRKKGAYWVDNNLYNGQYYQQQITAPPAQPAPMTAVTGEYHNPHPQFQLGEGCLIDQLVGQYRANRCGLGDLLDRFHIRQTLASIFQYNHHESLRDHYNNMRTFATPEEAGTVICSYPLGHRPERPFPYFGECMTGFEYQFAVLLLDYGMRDEAVRVVEAVRNRHDGKKRNPFNEPECGSYYARSMAAWALLKAWETTSKAI
jgi:non-lysosomal glucosylceramidase